MDLKDTGSTTVVINIGTGQKNSNCVPLLYSGIYFAKVQSFGFGLSDSAI